MLRGDNSQQILGQLSSLHNVYLIASIDHLHAPLSKLRATLFLPREIRLIKFSHCFLVNFQLVKRWSQVIRTKEVCLHLKFHKEGQTHALCGITMLLVQFGLFVCLFGVFVFRGRFSHFVDMDGLKIKLRLPLLPRCWG